MTDHINRVRYYGARKIRTQRMTLADRFRLWKRRRVMDDLAGVRT